MAQTDIPDFIQSGVEARRIQGPHGLAGVPDMKSGGQLHDRRPQPAPESRLDT